MRELLRPLEQGGFAGGPRALGDGSVDGHEAVALLRGDDGLSRGRGRSSPPEGVTALGR
ncbi:hypothetical protein [Streptomyces sp. NPDC056628]|uniref:hypothetical protein n=1 Tax=Streptomyces sp. NPDC056628 TaxID=3345882 RepID=UPI0036C70D99